MFSNRWQDGRCFLGRGGSLKTQRCEVYLGERFCFLVGTVWPLDQRKPGWHLIIWLMFRTRSWMLSFTLSQAPPCLTLLTLSNSSFAVLHYAGKTWFAVLWYSHLGRWLTRKFGWLVPLSTQNKLPSSISGSGKHHLLKCCFFWASNTL